MYEQLSLLVNTRAANSMPFRCYHWAVKIINDLQRFQYKLSSPFFSRKKRWRILLRVFQLPTWIRAHRKWDIGWHVYKHYLVMELVLYDTRVYEKFMEKVWSTVVRIIGIAEGKDDEVAKPRTNTSKIGRKRVLRHLPDDRDSYKRPFSSMQWALKDRVPWTRPKQFVH